MRSRFDSELETLNLDLIKMGALIENAIEIAVKALMEKDPSLAHQAMAFDNEIDEMEKSIERRCLKLLLQQQPVAKDLRTISTALKMITDMERIGDQAADISEITLRIVGQDYSEKLEHIPLMAQATTKMVKDSIDAFVNNDKVKVDNVIASDDIVDNLFNKVKEDLITTISKNPADGELAIDMLMIAKYFERIGDHAVNIAEWVMFSITGVHKKTKVL